MIQSNPQDIHGTAFFASIEQAQLDEALAQKARDTIAASVELIGQHWTASTAIKSDGELSETGKKSRLASTVERSDKRLAALTDGIKSELEDTTVRLSQSLANAANKPADAVTTQLMVERRAIAATFDPLKLQGDILQLAADGRDDLSVVACCTGPALGQLLTPAVIRQAMDTMNARILPDQAEQLRQARAALALLNNVVSTAIHSFGNPQERAFLAVPDAIQRAAVPASAAPQA